MPLNKRWGKKGYLLFDRNNVARMPLAIAARSNPLLVVCPHVSVNREAVDGMGVQSAGPHRMYQYII